MPTSQFDKPPTRHVENRHCQKPHGVNENQTMSVPGRPMRKVRDVCALPAYPLSCLPMLANVGNRRSNLSASSFKTDDDRGDDYM
jgi:hypothetical protein